MTLTAEERETIERICGIAEKTGVDIQIPTAWARALLADLEAAEQREKALVKGLIRIAARIEPTGDPDVDAGRDEREMLRWVRQQARALLALQPAEPLPERVIYDGFTVADSPEGGA